jgi:fumarate hydratase class II
MNVRIERDSLGEVAVPAEALYGAQTQRAVENFRFSPFRFPRAFLEALGHIKGAAAEVNHDLGLLEASLATAIRQAAAEVARGDWDAHFPLDIFQTGSGTSTNMNANEVIATLASRRLGQAVHPNDHVNLGQSSNDVIPSAIHASAAAEIARALLPALDELADAIATKALQVGHVVKTGRTHLMDAVPIRLGQEMGAWEALVRRARDRIAAGMPRLLELALGGTAVGTGINTHPEFGERVARKLAEETRLPFTVAPNRFAALSTPDAALASSAELRGAAAALLKISNDLRWMNSGPVAGLQEITLAALQPGSSIMPGKINPVIPEAVAMICAQVTANDTAILLAAQSGVFQLNVMLPLVAWNLLSSIALLQGAAVALARQAVAGFTVNEGHIRNLVSRNAILVTALTPRIGHDAAARIAQQARETGEDIVAVARRLSGLSEAELAVLLDPARMTGLAPAG